MPTCLITGASGGIGSAIAEALAPTHTLLLAGRPSGRLDAVATRLGATTWPLDLADPESLEAAAEPLAELDVLVHNAGVAYPGRVAESTPEQWRASFEVNVTGAVALTLALLPALRAARGQVVFVNSGAGLNVSPGLAAYSASKFALRAFADRCEPTNQICGSPACTRAGSTPRCSATWSPTRAASTTPRSSSAPRRSRASSPT